MTAAGKRGLIPALVLAAAAAAIAGAAAVAVSAGTASTHSSPVAHHALADDGVVNSRD